MCYNLMKSCRYFNPVEVKLKKKKELIFFDCFLFTFGFNILMRSNFSDENINFNLFCKLFEASRGN